MKSANRYYQIAALLPTSLVAITSTPVSATFFMITSPIWIGAVTVTSRISFMISKIFPLGISFSVLTETLAIVPSFILTLLVTIRVGFVTSFFFYSSPLGQVLPVTVILSASPIFTVSWHPIGQPMHISSLVSIKASKTSHGHVTYFLTIITLCRIYQFFILTSCLIIYQFFILPSRLIIYISSP